MKYTELKISSDHSPEETVPSTSSAVPAPGAVQPSSSDAASRAAAYVPGGSVSPEPERGDSGDAPEASSAADPSGQSASGSRYPKKIAIITGASSGLGQEFVRQIDADPEESFDEIWVIARRRERLEALQEGVRVPIRAIPLDLTLPASIDQISSLLAEENPFVGLLINAAGFGKIGSYQDISRNDIDRMIDLNCRAAVDMTQAVLPFMGSGSRILEICSTAGFQPFQYLNVYAATKAFLYRYSRALRVEVMPRGISVTAVCPYWITDTEFIGTARKTQDSTYIRHFPFSTKRASVVSHALYDSKAGFAVSTPGVVCTLHRFFSKICPDTVMMGIWDLIRRI